MCLEYQDCIKTALNPQQKKKNLLEVHYVILHVINDSPCCIKLEMRIGF